jgi:hypothetical protein
LALQNTPITPACGRSWADLQNIFRQLAGFSAARLLAYRLPPDQIMKALLV